MRFNLLFNDNEKFYDFVEFCKGFGKHDIEINGMNIITVNMNNGYSYIGKSIELVVNSSSLALYFYLRNYIRENNLYN